MTSKVEVGILMSSRMDGRENGRVFLELLPAAYKPEYYNDHEPINKKFECIDHVLDCWGWGFLWSRRRPRVLGSAWAGNNSKTHDSVYISAPLRNFEIEDVLELFSKLEKVFGVDIGYIHLQTSKDSQDFEKYRHLIMPFSQGLTAYQLREGLPGLCWATLLGSVYTEIFGARMEDVPVYKKLGIGSCTYLQLTKSIEDVDTSREEYEAAQEAAKEHLDSNVFRVMDRSGPYRIPEFNLS